MKKRNKLVLILLYFWLILIIPNNVLAKASEGGDNIHPPKCTYIIDDLHKEKVELLNGSNETIDGIIDRVDLNIQNRKKAEFDIFIKISGSDEADDEKKVTISFDVDDQKAINDGTYFDARDGGTIFLSYMFFDDKEFTSPEDNIDRGFKELINNNECPKYIFVYPTLQLPGQYKAWLTTEHLNDYFMDEDGTYGRLYLNYSWGVGTKYYLDDGNQGNIPKPSEAICMFEDNEDKPDGEDECKCASLTAIICKHYHLKDKYGNVNLEYGFEGPEGNEKRYIAIYDDSWYYNKIDLEQTPREFSSNPYGFYEYRQQHPEDPNRKYSFYWIGFDMKYGGGYFFPSKDMLYMEARDKIYTIWQNYGYTIHYVYDEVEDINQTEVRAMKTQGTSNTVTFNITEDYFNKHIKRSLNPKEGYKYSRVACKIGTEYKPLPFVLDLDASNNNIYVYFVKKPQSQTGKLPIEDIVFCEESRILQIFRIVGYLFFALKLIIPLVLIIMASIDLGRAVISNKEESNKEAVKTLVRRVIIGIVIYILPLILNYFLVLIDGAVEKIKPFSPCTTCLLDPTGDCNELIKVAEQKKANSNINK